MSAAEVAGRGRQGRAWRGVPQRGAKTDSNTGLENEIHHILTQVRNEETTDNDKVSQNGDKETDSTADVEFRCIFVYIFSFDYAIFI